MTSLIMAGEILVLVLRDGKKEGDGFRYEVSRPEEMAASRCACQIAMLSFTRK